MWDHPGPGIKPVPLTFQGGFVTTGPPGEALSRLLIAEFNFFSSLLYMSYNWSNQFVFFYVQFLSLKTMYVRFLYTVDRILTDMSNRIHWFINRSIFLILLIYILIYWWIYSWLTHYSVDGHLDGFWFGVSINTWTSWVYLSEWNWWVVFKVWIQVVVTCSRFNPFFSF